MTEKLSRRERRRRTKYDLNALGRPRGWHRGCPATEKPFLGTYELALGPKGRIDCSACGAIDLRRPS